jgi:hypothetical protein
VDDCPSIYPIEQYIQKLSVYSELELNQAIKVKKYLNMTTKFPTYQGAGFGESEIESYLEEIASSGWKVYVDDQPVSPSYVIVVDEEKRIIIWFFSDSKEWTVDALDQGEFLFTKGATNFQAFKELISAAMRSLGQVLDSGPKSIRLRHQSPLSNRVGLVSIAHGANVQCIFDPYFDDKVITSLGILVNLGLKLIPEVQILTTSKVKNRISQQVIDDFDLEYSSKLNIRICNSDNEHRRFLLLSSSESLVVGCSLNSLDKNEAAHVENSQEDRDFFESQWNLSNTR